MSRFFSSVARDFILLTGAILMAGLSVAKLRPFHDVFHLPESPLDRSHPTSAPAFLFLQAVEREIPPGESVTLITEPRDPGRETALFGMSVALLPGQTLLPSSQWSAFTPELSAGAHYLIVLGSRPDSPPGTLIYEDSRGSVWKRALR